MCGRFYLFWQLHALSVSLRSKKSFVEYILYHYILIHCSNTYLATLGS